MVIETSPLRADSILSAISMLSANTSSSLNCIRFSPKRPRQPLAIASLHGLDTPGRAVVPVLQVAEERIRALGPARPSLRHRPPLGTIVTITQKECKKVKIGIDRIGCVG